MSRDSVYVLSDAAEAELAELRRCADVFMRGSEYVRAQILQALRVGLPRHLIAEAAGVSEATVYRIARASREAS